MNPVKPHIKNLTFQFSKAIKQVIRLQTGNNSRSQHILSDSLQYDIMCYFQVLT